MSEISEEKYPVKKQKLPDDWVDAGRWRVGI